MTNLASPGATRVATFLVGALPLGIFLLWAAVDGGYPPTLWLPGSLALVALLVLLLVAAPQVLTTLPRTALAALGLLGGFALWSAWSIAWAGDKGEAWDAANRTLLYLAVYGIFLLWPWRARHGAFLLGAYALGVAGIALATLVSLLGAEDPYSFFIGGRYAEPVGYLNANCALFLSAFWPAVFLASRRETPWWLRGLFLAAAGFLLEQAILPQSRGSLFVVPAAVALYLALVPERTRSVLALAPVCLAAFVVRSPLLDLYPAWRDQTLPDALDGLAEPLVGSAAALFALGTVYGLVDRFAPLPSDVARLGRWIVGIVAVAAAVVAALVLLVVYGNPVTRAQEAWDEFSAGQQFEESSSYFGANLGSNRYDFWRVALGEFRDSPLAGSGAGNFADAYLRERESPEEPLYPHSLPVMVLSQTGAVGGLLFVGFPGLAAPALAWLGLAASLDRPAPVPAERPAEWTRRRVSAVALYTLIVVAVAISLTLPWLAAREVERAADSWRASPEDAYATLDRARTLNPLSARPDLVAGAIAMRLEDYDRAEAAFERALDRHGDSWYAELELAVIAAVEGRREDALARLDRAEELNPREETLAIVREGVVTGEPVDPHVLDQIFLQRVEERTS
jgi:tetratricopeptide (TPR) repeat protein